MNPPLLSAILGCCCCVVLFASSLQVGLAAVSCFFVLMVPSSSSLRVVRAGLASFRRQKETKEPVLHSRRQLCESSPGPGKMAQQAMRPAHTERSQRQQRRGNQQRDTALDRPQATQVFVMLLGPSVSCDPKKNSKVRNIVPANYNNCSQIAKSSKWAAASVGDDGRQQCRWSHFAATYNQK